MRLWRHHLVIRLRALGMALLVLSIAWGGSLASRQLDDLSQHYRLEIDCHHSALGGEGTGSVLVVFRSPDGEDVYSSANEVAEDECAAGWARVVEDWTAPVGRTVDHVVLEATGSDALLVDRLRLRGWHVDSSERDTTRSMQLTWGSDNREAWCLSTDPEDAVGEWLSYTDTCHRCLAFRVDRDAYVCR